MSGRGEEWSGDSSVTPDLVATLARAAGLPLAADRCEALAPLLAGLLAGCDRLARVDLRRVEPFAFPAPEDDPP